MTLRDAFRRLIAGPELPAMPNLGRNDRCWCGSGRKYKACHQSNRRPQALDGGRLPHPPLLTALERNSAQRAK